MASYDPITIRQKINTKHTSKKSYKYQLNKNWKKIKHNTIKMYRKMYRM